MSTAYFCYCILQRICPYYTKCGAQFRSHPNVFILANECLTHTDTDWKSFDQTRMECHPTYIMLNVPRCAFEIANFPFEGVTVGEKPSTWPELPEGSEYGQCKG